MRLFKAIFPSSLFVALLLWALPSWGARCSFQLIKQGEETQPVSQTVLHGIVVDDFTIPIEEIDFDSENSVFQMTQARFNQFVFEDGYKAALLRNEKKELLGYALYFAGDGGVLVSAMEAPGVEKEFARWLQTRLDLLHRQILVRVPQDALSLQIGLREAGFQIEKVKVQDPDGYVFKFSAAPVARKTFSGPLKGLKLYSLQHIAPALSTLFRESLYAEKRGGTRVRVESSHFDFEEVFRDPDVTLKVISDGETLLGFILTRGNSNNIEILQLGARSGPLQKEMLSALIKDSMEQVHFYTGVFQAGRVTSLSMDIYAQDPVLVPLCYELGFSSGNLAHDRQQNVTAFRMQYHRFSGAPAATRSPFRKKVPTSF